MNSDQSVYSINFPWEIRPSLFISCNNVVTGFDIHDPSEKLAVSGSIRVTAQLLDLQHGNTRENVNVVSIFVDTSLSLVKLKPYQLHFEYEEKPVSTKHCVYKGK